jgi:hypothetical protein
MTGRDLVIVACAISAGIHAAVAPEHFDEGTGAGAGVAVSAVALAGLAVVLTRELGVTALAATAVVLGARPRDRARRGVPAARVYKFALLEAAMRLRKRALRRDRAPGSDASTGPALLGPAEPEVGCEVCFDELERDVELELAGEDVDATIPACGRTSRAARPAARSTRARGALVAGEQAS